MFSGASLDDYYFIVIIIIRCMTRQLNNIVTMTTEKETIYTYIFITFYLCNHYKTKMCAHQLIVVTTGHVYVKKFNNMYNSVTYLMYS